MYALPIPCGFGNYTIVHLEMLNIMVALKVWGQHWSNKCVEIKCDNLAVVSVLQEGKARDPCWQLLPGTYGFSHQYSISDLKFLTFLVKIIKLQTSCPAGGTQKIMNKN